MFHYLAIAIPFIIYMIFFCNGIADLMLDKPFIPVSGWADLGICVASLVVFGAGFAWIDKHYPNDPIFKNM